jgi:hypothetical protein
MLTVPLVATVCLAQMVMIALLVSRRLVMRATTALHKISLACVAQLVTSAHRALVNHLLALVDSTHLAVLPHAQHVQVNTTQRKLMPIAHQSLQVSLRTPEITDLTFVLIKNTPIGVRVPAIIALMAISAQRRLRGIPNT